MPGLRSQAIAEVAAGFESGELVHFADWSKLLVDPGTPGTYAPGDEFEGDLAPGEKPWISDGDHDVEAKDEKDLQVVEGKLLEPVGATTRRFCKRLRYWPSVLVNFGGYAPWLMRRSCRDQDTSAPGKSRNWSGG